MIQWIHFGISLKANYKNLSITINNNDNYIFILLTGILHYKVTLYYFIEINMIMAMPLNPTPKLGVISIYRMKIHWAVAKLVIFFSLCWWLRCSPNLHTHYDVIFRWHLWQAPYSTTFFVTQYMIRVIGNQIASASLPLLEVSSGSEFCLKNYYVAFSVHTMNLTKLSITIYFNAILFCDLFTALFIKQQISSVCLWRLKMTKIFKAHHLVGM